MANHGRHYILCPACEEIHIDMNDIDFYELWEDKEEIFIKYLCKITDKEITTVLQFGNGYKK